MEGSDALLFWVEETWEDKDPPPGQYNLRPTACHNTMGVGEQVKVRVKGLGRLNEGCDRLYVEVCSWANQMGVGVRAANQKGSTGMYVK